MIGVGWLTPTFCDHYTQYHCVRAVERAVKQGGVCCWRNPLLKNLPFQLSMALREAEDVPKVVIPGSVAKGLYERGPSETL